MSSFQPPPNGFRDALRRTQARRRHRHLLEGAAGGAALAAVAALVLSVNPGGLVRLRQDQPAGHGQSSPSSASSSTNPQPPHQGNGLVQATVSPTAGDKPASPSTPTSAPTTTRTTSSPSSRAVLISTTPSRQNTGYSNLSPCVDTSGTAAAGWCTQPGSSSTGRAGHANDLSVSLCRLPGTPDGQASFPTTLESSFSVRSPGPADRAEWTLAAQHPGHPERHAVTVVAGHCLTWSLTWFARDNAGHDLPVGHYTLTVSIDADNISGPNQALVQNYDYTVTS